jgi:hypothetical protein
MMGKRRGTAQITTTSAGSLRSHLSTQKPALLNSDRSLCLAAVIRVLESSLSFAGPRECRWQGLEVPAMMAKRRGTDQITTASAGSLRSHLINTKTCSSQLGSLALFGSCNTRPGGIFELRWPARIPLARPGGAGHDGKTSWYGSNHNGVCRELAQPPINTKTCSSQLDRSLCLAAVICVLESSLSFAGPREYRWQGLDVPAMMGIRRDLSKKLVGCKSPRSWLFVKQASSAEGAY